MARLSLKFRIAGIIFLLELVMMAAVLGTTLTQYLEANRQQSRANETVLLNLFGDLSRIALFTDEYDELQPYIEEAVNGSQVTKIMLLDDKNRVVVSSDVNDVGAINPQLINNIDTFWRIHEISNMSGSLGKLAINFSHKELIAANRKALDLGVGIALVAMTLIAVVGVFIGYLLTRRLDRLKSAAMQLAQGDLGVKVDLPGSDEVAIVGQTFEKMARSIEKHVKELKARETELIKAQANLEQRIKERTIELAIARDQALESSRTKSSFLANMSHELRTPLNAIIGYSEILVEEAGEYGYREFVPDLNKIKSAGSHLLNLISDILDLSKIEAGKVEFVIEPLDINALVNDVSATISPLAHKKENNFTVSVDETISGFRADGVKVRQALINLLGNATKFTSNGEISLTVKKLCERGGAEWLLFIVKDTGIGISEEQLQKLFKEFTQADASTTRKFGGTGLGLTISRRYCRLMGGDILVHSELHEGSTFTLKLPVDVEIESDDSWSSQDVDINAVNVRLENAVDEVIEDERRSYVSTILVIDDDRHIRNLVSQMLNKLGFNASVAESGEHGLFLAKKLQPDAIILDVMMPDLDGWSVLKSLKNDPSVMGIPVILLTANDEENLGYALGATHFLRKPINLNKLEESVLDCVRATMAQTNKSVSNS